MPEGVKIGELAFHHTLAKMPKKQMDCNVLHTGRFKLRKDGRLVSAYDYRSFVIPDGVREIGEECFINESVLSLKIPDSVTSICTDALCSYKGKHITLPKTLKKIGSHALSCSNLEEIVIPGNVKEISHGCFEHCRKLKSVVVEEGVEIIDDHAFDFCIELKRVVLPKSLKKIGKFAFHWCSSLEEIVLPDGLEEIGELAFSGCKALLKVNIPQNVKIGSEAFWDICASRYIISFIGIDWEDISNAFKNYYDFSFVEIKGRKNAEEMIFDKDIASIFQTMNVYNNLQNVNVIMYMKETCGLEILSTIFENISEKMDSLLPNHIYVLQNIWLVDDNEQADDMVIRIYCGEHNGKN